MKLIGLSQAIRRIKKSGRLFLIGVLLTLAAAANAQESANSMPGFNHEEQGGIPLTGRHAEIFCEACHVNNQLEGTPRDCASCHNGSRAPGKPASHPSVGNDCSQCHTTANFVPFAFDHTLITQDCTSCHTGAVARGMPGDHIPIQGSCDNCHVSTGFTDVRVDHSAVVGECSSCHTPSGVAPSQPPDHIPVPASASCGDCHSTFRFERAVFDHMSVTDQPCASCHNNAVMIGKPANHIPAPETCSDCHTPFFEADFTNVDLDHSVVPGDCASCHFPGNTWNAPYKPSSHPPAVSEDCESCHNTMAFSMGRQFDHSAVMGAVCADCHGAASPVDAPKMPVDHADVVGEDCAACHVSTDSFSIVSFQHSETTLFCANCHITGAMGAPTRPAFHTDDVGECDDCHTSTTSFASVTMNHNADSDDCEACHIVNQASWDATPRPIWHTQPVMTGVDCASCHSTNESPALSSLNHLVVGFDTADCSMCHALASTPNTPPFHAADGVTSRDCTQCHAMAADPDPSMNHVSYSNVQCQECHFVYQDSTLDPNNPGSTRQTHVEGDDCTSCHGSSF